MKKTTILPLLFCFLILSSILTASAQSTLNLTVTTDKQSYNRGDVVSITGALTADSQSTNGLVGILLVDANGHNVAVRTVRAGSVNNQPGAIATAYLSDPTGNHLTSASAGSLAYFTITVVNKDTVPRDLLAVVSVYDDNGVPLTSGSTMQTQVPSNGQITATVSVALPSWAAAGSAYAYGELYSGWPNQGGYPLSQETAIPFTMTGIIQGTNQPSTSSGSQGSYAFAFKLPARASIGIYNGYVSSYSNGLRASNIVSFNVRQPADFNGDGALDFNDLIAFANNWIAYYNSQAWSQAADLNNDGKIDFNDLILFANAWIIYYSAA
jgi:hypothetical protein